MKNNRANKNDALKNSEQEQPSFWASEQILALRRQLYCCNGAILTPIAIGLIMKREQRMRTFYQNEIGENIVLYLPFLGDAMGALFSALSSYYFGRQKTLNYINIIFLGCLMIFISDAPLKLDWPFVIVWHAATRALMVSIFVYVAEVANPKWRAFIISLYFLMYQIAFFLGDLFVDKLKIGNFLCMATVTTTLVLSYLIAESPYWLVMADERLLAEQNFQYLRAGGSNLAEASELFSKAETDAADKRRGMAANILSTRFWWRLLIIWSLYLADNNIKFILNPGVLNTVVSSTSNSSGIVKEEFWRHFSSYQLMINIFPILGCLLYSGMCFFFSRRMLYIVPIIMTFSLYLSYYTTTFDGRIALYTVSFSYLFKYIGGDQIPRIMATEVFPSVTRDIGVGLGEFISVFFETFEENGIRGGGETWYYQILVKVRWAFIPLGLVFSLFYMPETKDLTLTKAEYAAKEMQELFRNDLLGESEYNEERYR